MDNIVSRVWPCKYYKQESFLVDVRHTDLTGGYPDSETRPDFPGHVDICLVHRNQDGLTGTGQGIHIPLGELLNVLGVVAALALDDTQAVAAIDPEAVEPLRKLAQWAVDEV
jgi:hypothetical protein